MTFGQRLKKFIKEVYQTQKNFATEIGLSEPIVTRYTSDKSIPGIDVLIRLQNAGLSIDWLLSGKGSMYGDHSPIEEVNTKTRSLPISENNRINNWILDNYKSIRSFCNEYHIDYSQTLDYLKNDLIPSPEILNALKIAEEIVLTYEQKDVKKIQYQPEELSNTTHQDVVFETSNEITSDLIQVIRKLVTHEVQKQLRIQIKDQKNI